MNISKSQIAHYVDPHNLIYKIKAVPHSNTAIYDSKTLSTTLLLHAK